MSLEMFSLIGIILGVAVFVYGVFKGYSITFATLVGAIVVALCSRMSILEALTKTYMGKLGGTMTSFMLLFLISALFAKMMGDVGAAQSLAYKMARLARKFPRHEKFAACLRLYLWRHQCVRGDLHPDLYWQGAVRGAGCALVYVYLRGHGHRNLCHRHAARLSPAHQLNPHELFRDHRVGSSGSGHDLYPGIAGIFLLVDLVPVQPVREAGNRFWTLGR